MPVTSAAALAPIVMTDTFGLAETIVSAIDASATRRPSTSRTLSSGSTLLGSERAGGLGRKLWQRFLGYRFPARADLSSAPVDESWDCADLA